MILSLFKKMVKATLLRLLSSKFEDFFYLTFHQISGIENLLWPMEYNAFNIHSRVRVMEPS